MGDLSSAGVPAARSTDASDGFTFAEKSDYAIIGFPAVVDTRASKTFSERTREWLARSPKVLILDFAKVEKLDNTVFRPVASMQQALKKKGGSLFTINLTPVLIATIRAAGLDAVFSPRSNLGEALGAAGIRAARAVIDVNFLNPFIEATQHTILSQGRTKLQAGRPFVKKPGEGSGMEIAAVISMSSQAFHGSIALVFPAAVFLQIFSNMIGKTHTAITVESEDAAGELLNVIFGQAKTRLNADRNFTIHEAVPTVVRGQQLSVHHTALRPALVIPFQTEAGIFHIEISADAA